MYSGYIRGNTLAVVFGEFALPDGYSPLQDDSVVDEVELYFGKYDHPISKLTPQDIKYQITKYLEDTLEVKYLKVRIIINSNWGHHEQSNFLEYAEENIPLVNYRQIFAYGYKNYFFDKPTVTRRT